MQKLFLSFVVFSSFLNFSLVEAIKINLSDKNLSEIPSDIDPEVAELKLQNNEFTILTNIPESLFKLQRLDIYNNKLRNLAGFPTNLPRLLNLDLSDNQLTNIDELKKANLQRLEFMDISGNPLDTETLINFPWENLPRLAWLVLPKPLRDADQKQIDQKIKEILPEIKIYWM